MRIHGTYPHCASFCREKTFLSPQGRGQSWSCPSLFHDPGEELPTPFSLPTAPSLPGKRKKSAAQQQLLQASNQGGSSALGREGSRGQAEAIGKCPAGQGWPVAGWLCWRQRLQLDSSLGGCTINKSPLSTHSFIHSCMHLFIQWTLNWEHTIPGAIPQPVARFSLLNDLAESSTFLHF